MNFYDNFILQVQRGVNPATRLLEFQYQNVSEVEIRGVEFQGEARFGDSVRLRISDAVISGNDVSGADAVPLNSIAPDQGTFGLGYTAPSNRWGSEVIVRAVHGQSQEEGGMMAGHGMHDDESVFDPGREWAVSRCMHGCLHVLLDRVSLTFTVEECRAVQNLMQRAAIAFSTDAPRRDSEHMH